MQPTCQETAQTELAQYIAAPPEMPEGEMELNRGDRKKLAELMLEYRPNENSQELAQQEETPPEQKEIYMNQLQPTIQLSDRKVQPHQTTPRVPKCEPARNIWKQMQRLQPDLQSAS